MKKLLCALLSILMVFTMTVPAFATEEEAIAPDYDGYPIVIVRGIDFGGLTYKDSGEKVLAFNFLDLINALADIAVGTFINKDDEAFADGIVSYAAALLGPLASDAEGNSLDENVGMVQYHTSMADYPEFTENLKDDGEMGVIKTAINTIGAENCYYFTYDWRKNPLDVADELKALIDTAKSESKKDKVHIGAASMGGMITTAYLYEYGSEDIDSVTYLSSAHNGTYVCGDAINGNIVFYPDVLSSFIASFINTGTFFDVISGIFFSALEAVGVFDFLCDFLNDFIAENKDKAYGEVIRNILGTSLGLWALCPDEYVDSGIDFIFDGCEEDYPVLIEKLADVKDFVCSTEDTINKAYADGVKITFVSNYGSPVVPVYEKSRMNGDRVLETELTSNFATVANFGETLSESELIGDTSYISPDKVINANTSLYKDYTWFVKGAPHVACNFGSDYSEFAFSLILSETQPSVKTSVYPQFMISDKDQNLTAQ